MRRADGQPVTVLVVDDEPVLAEMVSMALRYEGWNITTAGDGSSAIAAARRQRPDVVVLDVMLPDMSGLDVLHKLRSENPGLPVLLLTAKDAVEDRIAGLTAGGDDYVTKPFSIEEVVLRLRALLRRTGVTTVDSGAQLVVGDLVLDEDSHEVMRAGEQVSLTSTEFELLRFMMHNSKRVLSKAQILDRVWSYDFGGRSNIVELYISYLRKKIDNGREPMIHTSDAALMCVYRDPALDLIVHAQAAWTSPLLPAADELADRYSLVSGQPLGHWEFYMALAYFKLAIIAAGIDYRRRMSEQAEGKDTAAESVPDVVAPLIARGLAEIAKKSG